MAFLRKAIVVAFGASSKRMCLTSIPSKFAIFFTPFFTNSSFASFSSSSSASATQHAHHQKRTSQEKQSDTPSQGTASRKLMTGSSAYTSSASKPMTGVTGALSKPSAAMFTRQKQIARLSNHALISNASINTETMLAQPSSARTAGMLLAASSCLLQLHSEPNCIPLRTHTAYTRSFTRSILTEILFIRTASRLTWQT